MSENKNELDLKKLQGDFNDSWKNLKSLLDQQADEIRTHGETSTKTAKDITNVEQKLEAFDKEVKGYQEELKNQIGDLEKKMQRPNFGGAEQQKSVGEMFVESDAYKSMIAQGGNRSDNVQVKSFFKKDLDSTPTSGGVFVGTQNVGGVIATPNDELRIRDLLRVQTTTSNAIEFIRETGFTNASAIAPEKSLKPQSDLTFDVETATVKTIAHWLPVTRQIIQDATQLQNYANSRLMFGLKQTEEAQILYGDGVGENMQGIMTNADIQDQGAVAGGDSAIDHVRRAFTKARLAGYPPTGIVLHPSDWEDIELQKGTDGHYIWVNVANGGESRLWRVPVVQSTSIVEGEFLTGAFGLGAQIWDREQANIRVSEHHSDYFARNMLAILAEERLALTTYRPESFVKGTFAPTI